MPTRSSRPRSEEHTSALQSHRDLHSFPTRRSSDLAIAIVEHDHVTLAKGFGIKRLGSSDPVDADTIFPTEIGRAHVCTPVTQRSTLFPYTTLFRSSDRDRRTRSCDAGQRIRHQAPRFIRSRRCRHDLPDRDRKSTRLHSSHTEIYTLSLHDALPI